MASGNQMVLDQLYSDPNYVVDFIVDNNPTEVQAHLSGLNLLSGTPQGDTENSLKADVRAIDDEETLRQVLAVPYNNQATNYTGGLEVELSTPDAPMGGNSELKTGGTGVVLLNGVFSLGNNVLEYLTGQQTAENLEIQAELQQEQIEAQLEAERIRAQSLERQKVLGLPPMVFMSIIGAIAVIIVFAFATSKK
jgi:hypothetical protein